MKSFYLIFVGFIGLSVGSFINAFTWRYYLKNVTDLKHFFKKPVDKKDLSIVSGRSMCPNCQHKLAYFDLIPLLSWTLLKGKCRYCHTRISIQYPLVEIFSAAVSVVYLLFWPSISNTRQLMSFILIILIVYGLISLLVFDFKWYILPSNIIYFLFFLGIFYVTLNISKINIASLILSTIIGGGLFYFLHIFSSGKWIGGGDVRLGFLLGFILGNFSLAIMLIFLASLIGSVFSILLISLRRVSIKSSIPFGPFLIISFMIVQLFGKTILIWAKNHYLIV